MERAILTLSPADLPINRRNAISHCVLSIEHSMLSRSLRISSVFHVKEVPASEDLRFHSAKVRQFFQWWQSLRADHLPRRSDFDILDHAHLAESLFLVRKLDASRYQMRIQGEEVIAIFGYNPTGRIVSADDPVESFGHALKEYYDAVIAEAWPRVCIGDLGHADRGHIRFESIDCPLHGDREDDMPFIVGVIDQIP